MIAYLIMIHRYPDQFKRLFKTIYHSNNSYLVHVDKRAGKQLINDVSIFLNDYANAFLLESKNSLWGGYSLVDAEIRGIKRLLDIDPYWEFFINLSGQDFPLKSQENIFKFLDGNKNTEFIKIENQAEKRPDTLHRLEDYVVEKDNNIVIAKNSKRTFMHGVTPYIGNQWMILSRGFCEFIINSREIDRFKIFYRNTLIADEGFFQTVMMNTSYKPKIINDDKREIDWVPMGDIKLRPRDFIWKDSKLLLKSEKLFARKFDEQIDGDILTILESHLKYSQSTG